MKAALKVFRDILYYVPPYFSGALPVSKQDLVLYYGKEPGCRRVDFSDFTLEQLEHLSQYCEPASFCLGDEMVLDEDQRKAGKIDAEHFSPVFDVHHAGLVHVIRNQLLIGAMVNFDIQVERYQLNVYGKDSFFKPHRDTPTTEKMFGTLVIVLPTDHEGGQLLIRDDENEWTFDSGSVIKGQDMPSVAFVMFYSDLEHEVTKVTSGYRVSITYNLYMSREAVLPSIPFSDDPTHHELKDAFNRFLADPDFLPDGGYLGFCLRRDYAFQNKRKEKIKLIKYEPYLKGSDATLLQVSREVGLSATLSAHFRTRNETLDHLDVVCDVVPVLAGDGEILENENDSIIDHLCDEYNGRKVKTRMDDHSSYTRSPELFITWVNKPKFGLIDREALIVGNTPSLGYAYGELCLLVGIGPHGNRGAVENIRVPNWTSQMSKRTGM